MPTWKSVIGDIEELVAARKESDGMLRATIELNFGPGAPRNTYGIEVPPGESTNGMIYEALEKLANRIRELTGQTGGGDANP
jgi:hypothetical protein